MLCILYVMAVGALLGVAGVLVERTLPSTIPRRWLWCVIIPTSIFLPGYYRWHHAMSVTDMLEHPAGRGALSHIVGSSFAPLDPAWWAHVESYDAMINPLWLAASAVVVLWGLANALRVWQVVRASRRRQRDTSQPVVLDGVPVVVTDSLGPATVGLFSTDVLVPQWVLALPGIQRRYVLRHEDEHRRSHDGLILFVASLALILMPWNLAMWWQLRRLSLAIEMDCDNRVVTGLGNANAYGELLLRVAEAGSRGPRLQPALLGEAGMLERRLTVLLAPTPLHHVQKFLLPAVALGLLLVVISMPHPVLGRGPHTHVTISHIPKR